MVDGELRMRNLLGAPRPGPLTVALLQFAIQNSLFRIAWPRFSIDPPWRDYGQRAATLRMQNATSGKP
jgi:hypothetical protein